MTSQEWMPGDDPETHPLWEEQVELEYGAMRSGAAKLRDAVIVAESRNQMTRIGVVRHLADDWVPGVAQSIREWVKAVEKSKGGPKPLAYPHVKEMDPYMAAMVGTRTLLDYIGQQKASLQNVCMEIGRTLEYEQRIRLWEAKAPKLYRVVQQEMDKDKVTTDHRRRVNVHEFNRLVKENAVEGMAWDNWSRDCVFRVGLAILDCIIRQTGWFEIINDPNHKPAKNNSPMLYITVKEGLSNWLAKALDHAEINRPDFLPTVMPPKRWTSTRRGGYWTPYVKAPRLIRFKASQEDQKDGAADEYDALDMPNVYRALNMLQETPWAINKRVLDAFSTMWIDKRFPVKGLPELDEKPLPPRTPRMLEHKEREKLEGKRIDPDEDTAKEILEWKRRASPVYAYNAKREGRLQGTKAILNTALQFAKYEAFYFPHMLDFRGRMYPIPAFLHPQGNDLARGLLTFSTGAPITKENGGVRWLAIALASNWGLDKKTYAQRVEWVYENEAFLRAIAEDPIANHEWTKADKPFQALAAIFEWVDYLEYGEGFLSTLPVMVDGTCNGIQHLSALTRDRVAGSYVNLVPNDEPQDIYKFVARELQETLEMILSGGGTQGELARWWLELCERDLPRTLTKRQVMVIPYGGSKESFFAYTRAWLAETHPKLFEDNSEEAKEFRKQRIVFLALHLWDTCTRVVRGGMTVMDWLKECAGHAADADQPIRWVVPSGFVVRHFYGLERDKQIFLTLDGTKCNIKLAERTAKLSKREQLQGISPNFIHSLDASALTTCLNAAEDMGLKAFASVHDAYGTHAANMDVLADLLREAFVWTHEHDLLGMFRESCKEVMVGPLVLKKGMDPMDAEAKAERVMPKVLALGDLDLSEILNSQYFFA